MIVLEISKYKQTKLPIKLDQTSLSLSLSLYFYLSLRRHGTEAHSVTHTLRLWPVRVSESISLSLSLSLSMDKTGFPPFRGTRTKWGLMCHIGGGIPRVSITRPKEAHRTVCTRNMWLILAVALFWKVIWSVGLEPREFVLCGFLWL